MPRHIFENVLSLPAENIELIFRGMPDVEWAQFILNPRRLRGSDFLMRLSQGQWSERRFVDAVNATARFYAIPYGPSSVAPAAVREYELYFEKLEAAGLGGLKRPDLLVFDAQHESRVAELISKFGGAEELPFIAEEELLDLLTLAIAAIECENSLWRASKMPDYGAELRPMRRLFGKLGLPKRALLPTVILKEEDRQPLAQWQKMRSIPIHIWHAFYDRAYGLSLDEAVRLLDEGLIEPKAQVFQAPGGATTEKITYGFYCHYAYQLGVSDKPPELIPDFIEDKNGHILPYVRFEGGSFTLESEALQILEDVRG